jgi:hypothetical protein
VRDHENTNLVVSPKEAQTCSDRHRSWNVESQPRLLLPQEKSLSRLECESESHSSDGNALNPGLVLLSPPRVLVLM